MSALKQYFESAKRRKISSKKTVKPVALEEVPVVNQEKLNRAYDTLKNWDPDYSPNLLLFYESLDEDEYQYVLANRNDFSIYVKNTLWPEEYLPPLRIKTNLKVRELTDEGYKSILLEKIRERNKKIEERLSKFTIPPRPFGNRDSDLVNITNAIELKEKQLEDLKKNAVVGKYVPPNRRKELVETSPEVLKTKDLIQRMKNEMERIKDSIKRLQYDWEEQYKFDLRNKIEQELVMSGM